MGTCNNTPRIELSKYVPLQKLDQFFLTKIKLMQFQRKKQQLTIAAQEQSKKLQEPVFAAIDLKQEQAKQKFLQAIRAIKEQQPEEQKKIKKYGITLEEFVGLNQLQISFNQLRQTTQANIQSLKDQIKRHTKAHYIKIYDEIREKDRIVPLNYLLKQQDMDQIYQRWRKKNQQQINQAIQFVNNKFVRDQKKEYYQKRMQQCIPQRQLNRLMKMKPSKTLDPTEQTQQTSKKAQQCLLY